MQILSSPRYIKKRMLPSISRSQGNGYIPNKLTSINDNNSNDLRADRLVSSEAKVTAARARVKKRLSNYQKNDSNNYSYSNSQKHLKVQTEQWLEDIDDRPLEAEVAVQTDLKGDEIDAKKDPVSSAAERLANVDGTDKSTQILPDDPELFDFDEEVGMVLEAVVGKTVEQSILEVMEEEEKALEGIRALQVREGGKVIRAT